MISSGGQRTIVLLRMKGEYDDQLRWTEDDGTTFHINLEMQKPTQRLQGAVDFSQSMYECYRNVSGAEDVREEGRKEKFCDLQTTNLKYLLNDSIVLQVSLTKMIMTSAICGICHNSM